MTDDPRFDSAHTLLAADRYRRSRGLWRIAAFVALAVAVLALVGRFALAESGGGDHIARIIVDGTITTNRERQAVIEALADDERVKAVIVSINSPGGSTAGGEELYEALGTLRAQKPVAAVINELGASAAYMTAVGADRIFARRLSIVGSIGVLYQHVNARQLLDTIGIDLEKVASGPLKAEPDFDEPITGEVRASITAMVEDSFNWFVDVVAERRDLPREETLALADGRIVSGRIALDTGLIDAFGGELEATDWLEAERDIAADLPVVTAWPQEEEGFGWLTHLIEQKARSALGLPAGAGAVPLDGLVSLWQVDPSR